MKDEQIRIKIAEACGYERRPDGYFRERGHVGSCGIPDYPSDLNACHEMEKYLTYGQKVVYRDYLEQNESDPCCDWNLVSATARQRCEAFLRTKGLWIDSAP